MFCQVILKRSPCLTEVSSTSHSKRRRLLAAFASAPAWVNAAQQGSASTPRAEQLSAYAFTDSIVTDPSTRRMIGVRLRVPTDKKTAGLILYTPGLGSGLSNGQAWCEFWQAAGWIVVNLSHPVTNDSIWDTSLHDFQTNLKNALSPEQYVLRVRDCSYVLTHFLSHPDLKAYIDPARIGIAGHSFGALTVQTITGQRAGERDLRDSRIRAAIAFSPGAVSLERARAMSSVTMPFFSITGDHDQFVTFKQGKQSMRLGMTLDKREMIHAQLPAGKKQLFIMANADHMTFAGEPVDPDRYSRDVTNRLEQEQAQWSRISEMSTIFWQYNLGDSTQPERLSAAAYQKKLRSYLVNGDKLAFD